MNLLLQSSVFIHILAACIWIGGSIFLAAVFIPMLRNEALSKHAYALFGPAARRFRSIGWICLVALVITGFLNIHARGIALHDSAFWKSTIGHLLMAKVTVVLIIVALSIYHDIVAGPRAVTARREDPTGSDYQKWRKQASWIGRINLILSLAVLWIAVDLFH